MRLRFRLRTHFCANSSLSSSPLYIWNVLLKNQNFVKREAINHWKIQIWGQILLFKSLWKTSHVWLHAVLSWLSPDCSELSPAVRQGLVNSQIWLQIWIQRVNLPGRVKILSRELVLAEIEKVNWRYDSGILDTPFKLGEAGVWAMTLGVHITFADVR